MSDESGPDGLFVYGTLRFPEVLEALLGRVPRLSPARVRGWSVRALAGEVYPGMVAEPGAAAEGVLIIGLDPAERDLLDAFEGEPYEVVAVPLDGGGEARAYAWTGPTEPHAWDVEHFAEHDLPEFAGSCREWREWRECQEWAAAGGGPPEAADS
ncbi:gamma-glutamylcyclotransferase family protein [Spirillospora sp. NPDC029432]|uniref:gamma-glutamylcyclotransferase family protein n=1 Tax=Spirillospora sp. NPDC029432 TaxID=3154599 RepID=UPI003454995E